MRFFLLLLLPCFLFGSKILSYNIYERSNRVDIMLTFDTPYEGRLSQIRQDDKIVLKLQDASIEAPKIKNINTSYLHKMTITPINAHTEIILETASSVAMSVSKTSDAYGLRLRFNKEAAAGKNESKQTGSAAVAASLPTKKANDFNDSYYIVIAILLIGILIMLWLKKKMGVTPAKGKTPWLFKGGVKKEGITVRFQKPLDPKNRVVMIDYEGLSYLVVIGSSNVLLDKYKGNKPVTSQSEFDKLLDENRTELDSYLRLDNAAEVEPLESYKEKASGKFPEFA
jgi:hypothetical protein